MGCAGSAQKEHGEADAGAGGYDDQGGEEYQPLTQDEVNARIQCCDKTQHFTLAETGITLRYAYLSQRGYYPEDLYKANQDAFKIIEKFILYLKFNILILSFYLKLFLKILDIE